MMRHLKTAAVGTEASLSSDRQVRETVETIIQDVGARGDAAVREWSVKLDRFDRPSYRLSDGEIADCIAQLDPQAIADIRFAQHQVRSFAEK